MVSNTKTHILLIDDQPEEVAKLCSLIRASNMAVNVAESPKQGYQRALVLNPDLIVLDLNMPKMDGLAICRLLREAPSLKDTPIMFLSASTDLEDRLKALHIGAVDYVVKPFSPEEMLARIRIHLKLSKKRSAPLAETDREVALSNTGSSSDEVLLNAAITLLHENLAKPPSLKEVAKSLGTYEKRLLSLFREHLGTTVFAFLRESRIQKAKELLVTTSMSIEDISVMLGFSSAANFSTAFKTKERISPRDFRNHHRS